MNAIDLMITLLGVVIDVFLFYTCMERYPKRSNAVICVVYSLFTVMFIFMNMLETKLYIKFVVVLISIYAVLSIAYVNVKILNKILSILMFLIITTGSELIIISFVMKMENNYGVNQFYDNNVIWLQAFIMAKTIEAITIMIIGRLQNREVKLSISEMIILFMPVFINFLAVIIVLFDIVKMESDNGKKPISSLFVISLFLIVFTIFHAWYCEYYYKSREIQKEYDNLKIKQDQIYQFYNEKLATYNEIQQMKHDIHNHLILAKDEKYLSQLEEIFDDYNNIFDTGNSILDILLKEKNVEAKESNINLVVNANASVNHINDIDICILFGNLLDNAIEASRALNNCDKQVNITICNMQEFLFISVSNDIGNAKINIKNNHIETTKKDKKKHGIGLKGVENTVRKYNGQFNLTVRDNRLFADILIPTLFQ